LTDERAKPCHPIGSMRHTPHATRHTPHATRHMPHATRHSAHATWDTPNNPHSLTTYHMPSPARGRRQRDTVRQWGTDTDTDRRQAHRQSTAETGTQERQPTAQTGKRHTEPRARARRTKKRWRNSDAFLGRPSSVGAV
jgi:hypothetical protein